MQQRHGYPGAIQEGGPIKALLIEDDPLQRALVSRLLGWAGFEVKEAADGGVAIDFLVVARESFDLILLDIMLPIADGVEVARQALQVDPDLPIVACSAVLYGDNEHILRRLGVRGFLPKPFTADALREAIRVHARRLPQHFSRSVG
ncbi:MAG: response regulator [Isosphaeraceae bacterium]